MKFGQKGIGSATVFIVLAAAAFGTIGPPVLADAVDTRADSPFYSLEIVGEHIKQPFSDKTDLNLALAEERFNEFTQMVNNGKADKYSWLVEKANANFTQAITSSEDADELNLVLREFREYSLNLENVEANVSKDVEVELKALQLQSFRKVNVVENMRRGKKFSETKGGELESRLREIEVDTRELVEKEGPDLEFELSGNPEGVMLRTKDSSFALKIGKIQENPRIRQIENLTVEIEKSGLENYYFKIGPTENISVVWPEDNIRIEPGPENIEVEFHRENYDIDQPENLEGTVTVENIGEGRENRRFKDLVVEGDGVKGDVISREKPTLAPQAQGENVAFLSAETKWYASVVIAADEEYRADPQWRDKAESILEDADTPFIKEYGLNFSTVRFEGYNSDDSLSDPRDLFRDVRNKVEKRKANLMLAFSGQYSGSIGGIAELCGDDTIIFPESIGWPWNKSQVTQHELSHLYNAQDHDSGWSDICIMSYIWSNRYIRRWCEACQQRMNDYMMEQAPLRLWTEEEEYSPREGVNINLKNQSKRPVQVGNLKISRYTEEGWEEADMRDISERIPPGETYQWEWTGSTAILIAGQDHDPSDPGWYRVVWEPYDPERDEPFGRSSTSFSIVGSLLHVKPSPPKTIEVGENLTYSAKLVTFKNPEVLGKEDKDIKSPLLLPRVEDVTGVAQWEVENSNVGRLTKKEVNNRTYAVFTGENEGNTTLTADYKGISDISSKIIVNRRIIITPGENIENITVGSGNLENVENLVSENIHIKKFP
ncbi:hypothetical protein AKJ51_00355 [candidate division MSBL1 archaeon SCGC-AAA382A20]|uniref:DUF5667 domain-containing protein n=1 Tax=candidate division MSBL1 archaeon SCGC-AAA382A20 TaxID=1698280 RepID=A0A133VMT3_9EURY|nr:hypothetical protein AKJ51_00355 [candidate division MSBL1 archaeon SCGC-AAA382A20]